MNEKSLYIIDGNYIIYRSHYALINLKNSSGMNTGAVFGFCKTLFKVIKDKNPDYLVIAFDSKEKTFRDHIYADYKVNRPPMPDEIIQQIPIILEILDKLNLCYIIKPGFEADDIIGSIAYIAEKSSIPIKSFIITKDKDMIQLMDDNTNILYCDQDWEIIDNDWVISKFGIMPHKIIDYLSIVGDASDNVPGIKGIGPKGAQKLLNDFQSIEDIYDHIDDIKDKKLKEKLLNNKDNALLSKKLITIDKNIDLQLEIKDFEPGNTEYQNILPILEDLEFFSLMKELEITKQNTKEISKIHINSKKEIHDLIFQIKKEGKFAFFTKDNEIYIAFNDYSSYVTDVENVQELFFSEDIKKIAFNIKDNLDIKDYYNIFDTAIAFSLIEPDSRVSLENLSMKYLKRELDKDEDLPFNYAIAIYDLYFIGEDLLRENELLNIFNDIEMPLIRIISEMEHIGIKIDPRVLNDLEQIIIKKLQTIEADIYNTVGFTFNINSTKELQNILFNILQFKGSKKGKTGYSTSNQVLQELSGKHPLPGKIIEYRSLTKLINTYITVLPKLIRKDTGRIHTHFNQTNIITGRLSTNDPNLQSIPIRGEIGPKIRSAFIAPEDSYLVSADYSQIELRVLAHYSLDPVLIEAFTENRDIHTITATALFAFEDSMITPDMRRIAKAVNFGIIYGITPYGLSKQLGISQKEAKHYIRLFFNRYKGVKAFIDQVIKNAKEKGFVQTLYGRRRSVSQINSYNRQIQKFGERISINTIIQGTAAEIIKIAMIKLYNKVKDYEGRMILQIHDEILFEIKKGLLEGFIKLIRTEMVDSFTLNVPLDINIKYGNNWGEI